MPLILNGTTGVSGVDGTAATPAAQGSDTNTGVFYGTDTVSISTGGTARVVVNSSGQAVLGAGTAALPAVTTTGDTNTGIYFPAADTIAFAEGGSERARIDSSGNLLIRQTSQSGTACCLSISVTENTGNAGSFGSLRIGANTSGSGYPDIGYNQAYTSTSRINYNISDTAAWIRFAANGGRIETYTAASGTAGNEITPTAGPYVASGGTSWTSSSDERLKDILEPITGALPKVLSLRSIIGKFKTDPVDTRRVFLIAQDVQKVLPEAVDTSDPDVLGLNYTDIIPLLVASIKELSAKLDAAEARIAALEAK